MAAGGPPQQASPWVPADRPLVAASKDSHPPEPPGRTHRPAERPAERHPALDEVSLALFAVNTSPMWVVDRQTLAFLAVNDAAVRLYGYSREEFLAMTARDIRPAEDVPALLDYFDRNRHIQTSREFIRAGIWRHRRKDGAPMDVEIAWIPVSLGFRQAVLARVQILSSPEPSADPALHEAARGKEVLPSALEVLARQQEAIAKRLERLEHTLEYRIHLMEQWVGAGRPAAREAAWPLPVSRPDAERKLLSVCLRNLERSHAEGQVSEDEFSRGKRRILERLSALGPE